MPTIYKRGEVYYIDYRINGKRVRKRIGRSKQIAELALKDIEVQIAKGEIGFIQEDHSILDFLKQYLEFCKTNHSPATYRRYSFIIDHFVAFLDKYPRIIKLSHLKPKFFEDYKTWRKTGEQESKTFKRGAKTNTINMELSIFRAIFNQAIKWEYLKENPTKDVNMLKVTDAKKPRFLTKDECQKLLQECKEELYPIFYTFLNTGMRLSELLNLTWQDIDFKRKKIKIQAKLFWHPKTGEREIPMSQGMQKLLEKLREENKVRSKFIFHEKDGSQLKTKLREELIKTTKRCNFPEVTKIHSLRHTFASHLVMKGVDLPTVQKLMGHSDIQTTMIYSHLTPDHLVEAVDKLDLTD